MARQKIGWVSRGQYFTGYPEEKRTQQQVLPTSYISPYLSSADRLIAQRKRTQETTRRQQEESRLSGLLSRTAKGLGAGYPGQLGYVAPTRVSMQQQRANLAELQQWRRMKTGYGGVGGYVAPGQYVPSATSLSFMGGSTLATPSAQMSQQPTLRRPITPSAPPQQLGLKKFTTPTAPVAQPAPTYGITPQPSPQKITYQPAPAQTYQSTYYQANGYSGYRPYASQQTFGDRAFSYAYQRPKLYQSYTGI